MDVGEEDFVFFGTPIEREEDTSARKRKAVADAGQLRALPAWKQEVRDEEGRRRFHGAFTGGFSAGYYNTVGTKEGWTPQTFTSSRKNRTEMKKQSIYNFLDDEDIKDMGGQTLETSMQFDTFGFTAAEFARKHAEKEQEKRPSAIPGPAPDEIILPASDSIGVKLLLKMGWRHGHSVKDRHTDSIYEARREARKALMALSGNEDATELTQKESSMIDLEKTDEGLDNPFHASKSVPVFLLQPKQDLFGLGYDPYKHAPEFRDNKRRHESSSKSSYKSTFTKQGRVLDPKSRKYAPGFGIGALEELDIEDEDIYTSGFDFELTEVEDMETSREISYNKKKIEEKRSTCLPGFKVASSADYQLERFRPPIVPADFKPHHKFPTGVETAAKINEVPPPEVPPPEDNNLKLLINGFATLVARCGKVFEDLSKERNRENPLFSFLTGGNGHEYYERKLWEEKQQNTTQLRMPGNFNSKPSDKIMMAENRGRLLGEKPLQRSIKEAISPVSVKEIHFQSNLSDTFTKSDSLVKLLESAKPFENDPAKQERFEQFLKDKYQGGLRRTEASSGNTLSEVDRARERLDFEAAAEAIEKSSRKTDMGHPSTQQVLDIIGSRGQNFISPAGPEKHEDTQNEDNKTKFYLRREEYQWRPSPLLCKRFDIVDPFIGKPPPLPRPKSRMDSLFFVPEPAKDLKIEGPDNVHRDSASHSKLDVAKQPNDHKEQETEEADHKEQETEEAKIDLQRPVDLYKAIFSDDSDDDEEANTTHIAEPIKKSEGANTTLNRLVAGDFLESLGKELGLEVPPDTNCKRHDTSNALEPIDTRDVPTENDEKSALMLQKLVDNNHHKNFKRELDRSKSGSENMVFSLEENKIESIQQRNDGTSSRHHSSYPDSDSSGDHHRSARSGHSGRRQSRSRTPESYSSDDKHQAKHGRSKSKHRRRRSEDTDSSYDSREHDRSKFRSKKRSSHRTSERRHKHRRARSPSTYSSDDDTRDDRIRERRSRGRRKHSVDSDSKRRKKHSQQD